jgi:thioredoxin reductase
MLYDALVVGAGPAGMSASLVLARCRRTVLLCGIGQRRNHASHGVHCLLTHEGQLPRQFIVAADHDLARYSTLQRRELEVTSIAQGATGFTFTCSDGYSGSAKKVLLATGLSDELPPLAGIGAFYGCSVHHCLYCDGFEYADKPVAAFGDGDKGAGLALMMKQWSADVVLLTGGGQPPSPVMQGRLKSQRIRCIESQIDRLEGDGSILRRIQFSDGTHLDREALFFSTGCHQRSDLWRALGCARDDKGGIITDPLTEETTAPGVYVAGDVSRDVLLIAVALAEGAKAAVAINRALLREGGLL